MNAKDPEYQTELRNKYADTVISFGREEFTINAIVEHSGLKKANSSKDYQRDAGI